ncbi:G-protein alpha subunit-domain-containing protein [Lactarius psammicola]|nr:G-protein alpha subunit-domain-containing protein [Lactarius psammicola]
MGHCASNTREVDERARFHSDLIDRQIEEDSKKYKRECRILLLGSGESGKSTIVKQMKIIHQNGFTPEEILAFRPIVWKNLLQSASGVVLALARFNLEPITVTNRVRRHLLSPTSFSYWSCPSFSGELRTYLGVSARHR